MANGVSHLEILSRRRSCPSERHRCGLNHLIGTCGGHHRLYFHLRQKINSVFLGPDKPDWYRWRQQSPVRRGREKTFEYRHVGTCVEATVRYAGEFGCEVTMVKDATASCSDVHMHAALEINTKTTPQPLSPLMKSSACFLLCATA